MNPNAVRTGLNNLVSQSHLTHLVGWISLVKQRVPWDVYERWSQSHLTNLGSWKLQSTGYALFKRYAPKSQSHLTALVSWNALRSAPLVDPSMVVAIPPYRSGQLEEYQIVEIGMRMLEPSQSHLTALVSWKNLLWATTDSMPIESQSHLTDLVG